MSEKQIEHATILLKMAGFPAAFPLAPLDPVSELLPISLQYFVYIFNVHERLIMSLSHEHAIIHVHNIHKLHIRAQTWGLSFHGPNPFDTQPLLQFNNSLKDGGGGGGVDDTTIDDTIDVDGLHDAANFLLGNTLHYTPHNFHQSIVIPYPTTIGGCCYDNDTTHTSNNNKRNNNNVISLPVCAKCKRHYKTRENCRVKYMHTDVPWTNSFICITIDESCIGTDGTYIIRNDQKLHAVVLPSPPPLQSPDNNNEKQRRSMTKYVVNSCLDGSAPVCLACKQSNRTKAYCRKKFRHRELPWNTLFVLLKLQQQHTADGDGGGDGGGGSITFQSSIASTERDGGDRAIGKKFCESLSLSLF